MKALIFVALLTAALAGCDTDASVASRNLSKAAGLTPYRRMEMAWRWRTAGLPA